MKDRFKFRVWCVNKKQWEENRTYLDSFGRIYDDFRRVKEDTHIIQQCTGLKDKNGKLIYEGDIIKYICGGETIIGSLEIDRFNLLTFTNMTTCAFCEDWTEIVKAVFFAGDAQIEIIGNIYENKELLGEQK